MLWIDKLENKPDRLYCCENSTLKPPKYSQLKCK